MKNNFEKTNAFSFPIYKIRIDPNSYDKEEIVKDIKYNKSLKNTRNASGQNFHNCDIHHSYNDYDNEDFRPINYDKLGVVYQEIFQRFFDKEIMVLKPIKWQFEIVNYTAMTEGQYFPSHNHIGMNDFASIHYLNFKKDHNPTYFNNPATFSSFYPDLRPEIYDLLSPSAPNNSYLWEHCKFPAEEDDLIIFPAALNHEIWPQGPTKELRITISTNLRIEKNYEESNN